jgi:hypothetical protein
MTRNTSKAFLRFRGGLFPFLMILALTSCGAGIETVRFTSRDYPPNKSVGNVEILEKTPDRPYVKLAQLTIANSKKSGSELQVQIREEAAKMGANAVVFSDPVISYSGGTQYAPVYQPWGYYSPYYGGYYGGAVVTARPIPYKERYNSLSGLAIRYTDQ